MGQAILYGQKQQGIDIQGIIDDYYAYAGENISAGDFVEFVQGVASRTDRYGSPQSFSTYSPQFISAITLDGDKFLLAYATNSTNSKNGIVVLYSVSSNRLIHQESSEITFQAGQVTSLSITRLANTNSFAIGYTYNNNAYVIGGSVTDTTITLGNPTTLKTGSASVPFIFTEIAYVKENTIVLVINKLSGNKVTNFYCSLVNINIPQDNTILTSGNYSQGSSTYINQYSLCLLKSSNTTVNSILCIAFNTNSDSNIHFSKISITSSNAITFGNRTSIAGASSSVKICALSETKMFAMFYSSSRNAGVVAVYDIPSSGNLTKLDDVEIANQTDNTFMHVCKINDLNSKQRVVITYYSTASASAPKMRVIEIDSSGIITLYEEYTISAQESSYLPFLLHYYNSAISKDCFLRFYRYSSVGRSMMYNCNDNILSDLIYSEIVTETQVRKVTTPQFDGIAQTSGSGGSDTGHNQQVEVLTIANPTEEHDIVDTNYVSMYNEVMTTSDDNTFIVEEE